MSMNLSVVSIRKNSLHDVEWIECTTGHGNRIIQPGHEPIMLRLLPGSECIFQTTASAVERIKVSDGFLYITRTNATLLLDE